jgi:sulfur-oxidizing protein SoxY
MDTGLAAGIPTFHIEQLKLQNATGETLAEIQPAEPVSENPVFSVEFPNTVSLSPLRIVGSDNNGNVIKGELSP